MISILFRLITLTLPSAVTRSKVKVISITEVRQCAITDDRVATRE